MKIHFRSYIYDVYIINFCRPHTRVFYFFVQKEGHHLAASLLILLCQEHFICPVCDNCTALVVCPYMRVFPLLNRSDVFHTRVFYFFVQKEGHHLAASLLILLCQEHFICPVCDNCTALVVCPYMRVFLLLNRSDVFLAPLTRRQKNSVSNSKTTIYVPEQSRQCTFIPCQTNVLCASRV